MSVLGVFTKLSTSNPDADDTIEDWFKAIASTVGSIALAAEAASRLLY